MTLTIKQLQCFVAVAEELHFGRAAEKLDMTQPPLSRQIGRLEAELGCKLFDRSRRRVRLTPAGVAFLAGARRTLGDAALSARQAREVGRRGEPVLRIGYIGPAAGEIVPEGLRRFRLASPETGVFLEEGTTPELLSAVKTGDLDVAFVRGPIAVPGVHAETVVQQSLLAVLPADHPLGRCPALSGEMLQDEGFVSFPRHAAPGIHDAILAWCRDAGFVPRIVTEATVWTSIVNLVAAGFGVSILADAVRAFERAGVVYRPLAGPASTVDVSLVRHPAMPSPPVRRFLRVVAEIRADGIPS